MTSSKDYFGKHKAILRAFGVSLAENESVSYKIYAVFMIAFFDVMYVTIALMELFKHDISVIGDTIVYQFAVTLALTKTLLTLRFREKFRKILEKLEQPPFKPDPERGGAVEEKIMEECIWITNLQTQVYWIIIGFTVITGVTYSLIQRLRNSDFHELTYGPISVFNTTNSPGYEITVLYQGASFMHLGMLFATMDLLLAGIMAHISYQFKMLQNNLQRLVTVAYNKMLKDRNDTQNFNQTDNKDNDIEIDGSKIPLKYLKESLTDAVRYHLSIIDLANEIENVFSILLLFVFLSTLIMGGFLTLRTSQMALGDARLFASLGEISTVCMQVLIVCYWGEEMVLQSQQVGTGAYKTNFVGTDIKFQKSLVLIIRRSLNPTSLTAGKFAPIRLSTFIWIIRSAYSAFMVLRSNNVENLDKM